MRSTHFLHLHHFYHDAVFFVFFFFNDTATTEIYTLSLHDALPISGSGRARRGPARRGHACCRRAGPRACARSRTPGRRSEEHTSELQSRLHLVCRLLLEKKKKDKTQKIVQKKHTETNRVRSNPSYE